MKRKIVIYAVILLVIAAAAYILVGSMSKSAAVQYQFASLTRGNLESTISASGTLSPLTTVDVGTQVSGTIDTVFIDYNDHVKDGQLLAVLDTVLLKTAVRDAEANFERAEAQLEQANFDNDLNETLFKKGMISEADLMPFKINVKTQNANLKSAQATLERALRNLQYAVIRSPISGTVIAKNVEAGQTVAASFSTPTLFQIAEDLSRMEILVDVGEGDIGQIKSGQAVRFEVQAYQDKKFEGTVRQVRMQPNTISNVVSYTAVVDAANKDYLLLPGMTATVDFIIEQKNDILLVPSKALRFKPSEEQLLAFQERLQKETKKHSDSAGTGGWNQPGAPGAETGNEQMSTSSNHQTQKNVGQLWYFDSQGQLTMDRVHVGMTDGTNTEIMMSRNLKEGMQVITGNNGTSSKSTTSTGNTGPGFRMRGF